MTEPRRFQSITERAAIGQTKPLSLHDWAVRKRQAALYAQGLFQSYRDVQPMPAGSPCPCGSCADVGCDVCPCHRNRQLPAGGLIEVDYAAVEARYQAQYAERDAQYTLDWWQQYTRSGPAQYPNKLRAKNDQVRYAHELLHWDTVMAMARPTHLPCGCL